MSRLTFSLRGVPPQRVDLSCLTPAALNGKSPSEINALPIQTTRRALTVGELFDVQWGDLDEIVFEGGSERLDRVGAGLTSGAIRIVGEAGVEVGRGMINGCVRIEGSVGPFSGSGMRGGMLEITGDAGERLGGPLAGETEGMNGGVIHVLGGAGPRAGDRLRRGFILIEGAVADYAGSRMIAGTMAIGGKAGAFPGYLMNRGTILLSDGATEMSPTFRDCGTFELVVARLLASHVEPISVRLGAAFRTPLRRFAGDLATLGMGEIFTPAA
jgi:formylmethanofuran dehydrogenase subunit C